MKTVLDNLKIDTIRQVTTIILMIIISTSIVIVVSDIHQQSLLDREYGKLLIQEKEIQLNTIEDHCGH